MGLKQSGDAGPKVRRERLTDNRIRDYACPLEEQQVFYRDTETPCLAVRVTRAGAKSFVFEAKLGGKTIRTTIGGVDEWVLDSVWQGRGQSRVEIKRGARDEAQRLKTLVDQGLDPRTVKAEQMVAAQAKLDAERVRKEAEAEAQRRKEVNVGEAWSDYLAYQKQRMANGEDKCWGSRHLHDHEKLAQVGGVPKVRGKGLTEPAPLASLMLVNLVDLSAETMASWLQAQKVTRPVSSALAFRLFRAFLRWCASDTRYQGLVLLTAINAKTVRDKVARPAAKKGDCLQREQLKPWFSEVRKLSSPTISAFLQVLVLTGARRGEIERLRWEDVDFQWKRLEIRDKIEGERTIPLTPFVAALLADLKRRSETPPPEYRILHGRRVRNDLENWKPSPWVFTGSSESGRMTEPSAAHKRALRAGGLPDITLHGLRRTFATQSEWCECPVGVVAQIMGHKPSAVAERHYIDRPIDLLRSWHTKIESWILAEAGIEVQAEIVTRELRAVVS